MSDLMLAVDGGGTKTEFLLFDEAGKIYQHFCLSGSNPNSYGIEACIKVLDDGVRSALSHTDALFGVYFGVAGFGDSANRAAVCNYFEKAYPSVSFAAEPDCYNIANSCTPAETYVSAICGTGSVVCAVSKNGIERMGGYGYLFDKSLSGYQLGRDALYATLRTEDGLEKQCRLTRMVQSYLGGRAHDNINHIYNSGREYIADIGRFVFEACDMGDSIAENILCDGACELAFLINSCISMYDTKRVVTLSGGLTKRSDVLIPLLKNHCKETEFAVADMPQIYGAALYCCNKYANADDSFKSKLKQNLTSERK